MLERSGVASSVFGYASDPTDLVFLRVRYDSPEMGRFITPDSIVPNSLSSQGWNRYAYVGDNPVRNVDPSRHFFKPICMFGKDPKTGECKTPLPPVVGAAVSQVASQPVIHPGQMALEAAVIGYLFLTQFPLHAPDFDPQPGTTLEPPCTEFGGFQLVDVLDLLPPTLRQPIQGSQVPSIYSPFPVKPEIQLSNVLSIQGNNWSFGKAKSSKKWQNQMVKRGWTSEQITEAINQGQQIRSKNFVNPNNPAIRYIHPETGRSVVVDTVTREVIHIGGDNYGYSNFDLK